MNIKSLAWPIVTLVAAQALLGWSEAAERKSAGRGWPISVSEFGPRADGDPASGVREYPRRHRSAHDRAASAQDVSAGDERRTAPANGVSHPNVVARFDA